jgi:negative regulator of flagellin synthesis FlgM
MDSTKVGPNISAPLTGNSPVQKSKGVQKEGDAKKTPVRKDSADFNVNLSERAKDMQEARTKAMDIARNTPDVREDRVADLKKRIETGEYKANAEHIADGMMREAIRDEISKDPEL